MEPDIKQKITNDFGPDALLALQLIEDFETQSKLSPRISRCVIHLSKGNITELKKNIAAAEGDWRDVIMWAETTPFEFKKPFKF